MDLSAQIQKLKKKDIVDLRKQTPLITELPPAIGQLTSARELLLGENDISTLPDEIGKLVRLELLDVSRNRITALPSALGQMAALRTLNVAENKLFFTCVNPAVGQLKNLQRLDLTSNQVRPGIGVFVSSSQSLRGVACERWSSSRRRRVPLGFGCVVGAAVVVQLPVGGGWRRIAAN